MENQQPVELSETIQKPEPPINWRIIIGSIVMTIALMSIVPSILFIALPSIFYVNPISHLMDGITGLIALLIGIMVGYYVKKNVFLNGLLSGILTVGVIQITIVPSSRMGIASILEYSLIIGLPIIVGALIGGAMKKEKTE